MVTRPDEEQKSGAYALCVMVSVGVKIMLVSYGGRDEDDKEEGEGAHVGAAGD